MCCCRNDNDDDDQNPSRVRRRGIAAMISLGIIVLCIGSIVVFIASELQHASSDGTRAAIDERVRIQKLIYKEVTIWDVCKAKSPPPTATDNERGEWSRMCNAAEDTVKSYTNERVFEMERDVYWKRFVHHLSPWVALDEVCPPTSRCRTNLDEFMRSITANLLGYVGLLVLFVGISSFFLVFVLHHCYLSAKTREEALLVKRTHETAKIMLRGLDIIKTHAEPTPFTLMGSTAAIKRKLD